VYQVHLTKEQRAELIRRTREPGLKRRTRDRLEFVRLADAGLSVPQLARLFHADEGCVRCWLKRFLSLGFAGLEDQPHPGQPSRLTPALLAAVRAELEQGGRTWTLGQIADWLESEHGLRLTPDHLGFLLRRAKLSCHRTERSLRHAQDPAQVAERQADLETLEQGGTPAAWMSATWTRPALL
jgi:transposase